MLGGLAILRIGAGGEIASIAYRVSPIAAVQIGVISSVYVYSEPTHCKLLRASSRYTNARRT